VVKIWIEASNVGRDEVYMACVVGPCGFCLYSLSFFHVHGIFILFSCMLFLVKFRIESQKIKGKGRLYLCEEEMEW
jgi:hypothetical protein